MGKVIAFCLAIRLYTTCRWICYIEKVPFKYVADELTDFLFSTPMPPFLTRTETYEYLVLKMRWDFIPYAKATKLAERNRFKKKIEDTIK